MSFTKTFTFPASTIQSAQIGSLTRHGEIVPVYVHFSNTPQLVTNIGDKTRTLLNSSGVEIPDGTEYYFGMVYTPIYFTSVDDAGASVLGSVPNLTNIRCNNNSKCIGSSLGVDSSTSTMDLQTVLLKIKDVFNYTLTSAVLPIGSVTYATADNSENFFTVSPISGSGVLGGGIRQIQNTLDDSDNIISTVSVASINNDLYMPPLYQLCYLTMSTANTYQMQAQESMCCVGMCVLVKPDGSIVTDSNL